MMQKDIGFGPEGCRPLTYGQSWKICPFDRNHIFKSTKELHVNKCRRAYLAKFSPGESPPLQACRYNRRHIMLWQELEGHEEECSRTHVDPSLFNGDTPEEKAYREKVREIEAEFAAEEKEKRTKKMETAKAENAVRESEAAKRKTLLGFEDDEDEDWLLLSRNTKMVKPRRVDSRGGKQPKQGRMVSTLQYVGQQQCPKTYPLSSNSSDISDSEDENYHVTDVEF